MVKETEHENDLEMVRHPRLFTDVREFDRLAGRIRLSGPVPSHKFLEVDDEDTVDAADESTLPARHAGD